jgi:hypothetical protein
VQAALNNAFQHAFLQGLSNAYFLTFGVAAAAFAVALLLPGWPFGWKRHREEAASGAREETAASDASMLIP